MLIGELSGSTISTLVKPARVRVSLYLFWMARASASQRDFPFGGVMSNKNEP